MEQIVNAIKENRCVIFAGAGISCHAGLPDWSGLGSSLYQRLTEKGKVPKEFQSIISELLSKKENISKVIDLLLLGTNRMDVTKELRDILEPTKESRVHEILKKIKLRGFIITNYDRLLEGVISPSSYRLTNSLADLKLVLTAVKTPKQFLLKLHGDIDNELPPDDMNVRRGSSFMVLSKSDYAVLIQSDRGEALCEALRAILQEASILFLGYSFTDPNILQALDFLLKYLIFPNQSWFVGLKGESLPHLPNNITGMQLLDDWSELSEWLNGIYTDSKVSVSVSAVRPLEIADEDKRALRALGEYIYGLETENLCEKTLGSIIIEEILEKEEVKIEWFIEFIGRFLSLGPAWADAYAKITVRQLLELGVLKDLGGGRIFKIVRSRINTLHKKAVNDFNSEREEFFESVKLRISGTGINFTDAFKETVDTALLNLCINFGQQVAEWFHRGIGKEISRKYVHEIIPICFAESNERRKAENLFDVILDDPSEKEVPYIYRLLSAAFLLNSIRLDPSASKFLKESIAQFELYLDSNILLPLLIKEHRNHQWISSIITASKDAGAALFAIEDIFEEVLGHKEVAKQIWQAYSGDIKSLSLYSDTLGLRANCFVQGYLNRRQINWNEYMHQYGEKQLRNLLEKIGVKLISVQVPDRKLFGDVLSTIKEEWNKRTQGPGRRDKLNEDDAKQFLHIYSCRTSLTENGRKDEVWFLSYETVLEKVYLREPQKWGKPPTFPMSAWASFLDSSIIFEHKNRRDLLKAILKGNSTAYDLPDTLTIVRRKAFGSNRILTDTENEVLNTVMSGGQIVERFEKARQNLVTRAQKASHLQEYEEASQELVAEINKEFTEQIENLERRLRENQKASFEEVLQLKQEIENLKIQQKRRRRYKKHKKIS